MKVPLVLVSVAIVIAVAVFGRVGGDDAGFIEGNEVLSNVDETDNKGVVDEQVEGVSSTQDPIPIATPTPSLVPQASTPPNPSISNSEYVFPGASVISDSGGELIMQSNSGTDEITEWYQAKLKSLGMNVNTSVKTQANEKVLNKLAASGTSAGVGVEISKDEGSSTVRILVTFN